MQRSLKKRKVTIPILVFKIITLGQSCKSQGSKAICGAINLKTVLQGMISVDALGSGKLSERGGGNGLTTLTGRPKPGNPLNFSSPEMFD